MNSSSTFSFLDEMAVIRSSVLSKRWIYLWTWIPFPLHIKEKRSFLMELRIFDHQLMKLLFHEKKVARNGVSDLSIFIAKTIISYFFFCLLVIFMLEFKHFALANISVTLHCMKLIYTGECQRDEYSSLCVDEASLKELKESDAWLTSKINSVSTTIPMMQPILPEYFQPKYEENFQPKYEESTKSYALFGMLVLMIISCSLAILNWKFELGNAVGVYDYAYDHFLQLSSII